MVCFGLNLICFGLKLVGFDAGGSNLNGSNSGRYGGVGLGEPLSSDDEGKQFVLKRMNFVLQK